MVKRSEIVVLRVLCSPRDGSLWLLGQSKQFSSDLSAKASLIQGTSSSKLGGTSGPLFWVLSRQSRPGSLHSTKTQDRRFLFCMTYYTCRLSWEFSSRLFSACTNLEARIPTNFALLSGSRLHGFLLQKFSFCKRRMHRRQWPPFPKTWLL